MAKFRVKQILHGYHEVIVEADSEHEAREMIFAIAMKPEQVMSTLSSDGIAGGYDVEVEEVGDEEWLTQLTAREQADCLKAARTGREMHEAMEKSKVSLGIPSD